MSTSMPDNSPPLTDETVSELAQVFVDRVVQHAKLPRGTRQAWVQAQITQDNSNNSVGHIFQARGAATWLAFYLVKFSCGVKRNTTDNRKLRYQRTFLSLQHLSAEAQQRIAERVAQTIPEDVKATCEQKLSGVQRSRAAGVQSNAADAMLQHGETQQAARDEQPAPVTGSSSLNPRSNDDGAPPRMPSQPVSIEPSAISMTQEFVYVNAHLAAALPLFSTELYNAIGRNPDSNERGVSSIYHAAIRMTMSSWACEMALEIMPDVVPSLAEKWFGAEVKIDPKAGHRYMTTNSGRLKVSAPKMTLRGCRHAIIQSAFQNDMKEAVLMAPSCWDSVSQGREETDGIAIEFSDNAQDRATIHYLHLSTIQP
ncbi:hypothetical protein MRS44_013977 [Fusarium solani]|uniref:uncharacterized protein n=1 Tax=Fusarium solani TaxID=169388 RepID=UPI0032C46333|nr:hypothetical protein MRS44_013977 [Fusarium solani]